MSDDNKCPRCGNKMKNGKCPFCPKRSQVTTIVMNKPVVEKIQITDEALNQMIDDFYRSSPTMARDCKACGHSARSHSFGGIGTCNECSCKAFK